MKKKKTVSRSKKLSAKDLKGLYGGAGPFQPYPTAPLPGIAPDAPTGPGGQDPSLIKQPGTVRPTKR